MFRLGDLGDEVDKWLVSSTEHLMNVTQKVGYHQGANPYPSDSALKF